MLSASSIHFEALSRKAIIFSRALPLTGSFINDTFDRNRSRISSNCSLVIRINFLSEAAKIAKERATLAIENKFLSEITNLGEGAFFKALNMSEIRSDLKNIFTFFQKYFDKSKISGFFALELNMRSPIQNANMGGRFVSAHNKGSIRLSNHSGNRPKAFIGLRKSRFGSFLSYCKSNFYLSMRSPVKNATPANNSSRSSRKTHVTGISKSPDKGAKMPQLDISGIRHNSYLRDMRKVLREFLREDCLIAPPNYSLHNMNEKITAARLLNHEDRVKLHQSLVLERQVQALTAKTAQP